MNTQIIPQPRCSILQRISSLRLDKDTSPGKTVAIDLLARGPSDDISCYLTTHRGIDLLCYDYYIVLQKVY